MPQQSPNGTTLYDVLGVAATADQAEIRRAYHQQARRWHPDRVVGLPAEEAERAESRMRKVNEAWEVLGTPDERRAYDRRLRSATEAERARTVRSDDGVVRIDPRLLDPDFVAARRRAQHDDISNRSSAILRVAPVLIVLVLLGGIFVFTAYARGTGGATTSTVPGPSLGNGIEANMCVSIIEGPVLLPRPCDANAAGRVIGARLPDGTCPVGTIRDIQLSNGAIACLGPVS